MARIYCGWDAGYTAITSCNGLTSTNAQLFEEGCSFSSFTYTFTPLQGDPNFTCDVARTHSVQNWEPLGGIRWLVSGNTTNTTRVGRLDITYYDTEGNSYYESTTITQPSCSPTPSDRWVYLNPSAATYAASVNGSKNFTVRASGCTIDSARTPVFTLSGDTSWFSIQQSRFNSSGYWQIYLNVSRNLTTSARDAYISVLGVYDTDGNRYDDLVFHATQNWGSYTFINYNQDNNMTSGGGIETVEAVGVNTTVCSISLTYSGTSTPEYWEGVEQPTITVSGNIMTINWPANPFNADRRFNFSTKTTWGDNCEYTSSLSTGKWQDAAADRYIRFADSATTVPTRNAAWTTTLEYSGCTVDSGNCEIVSIVGNLPITGVGINYSSYEQKYDFWFRFDGPNVSPDDRSSELTVRFYDTDGNSYLSTITINQPADEYIMYHAYGAPQYSSTPIVNLPSSKLLFYDEVIPINTQVCSIQLGTTGSSLNPQLWEGVEKPAISVIGNYIRLDWPANPFEESRSLTYNFTVVWGDECEHSEMHSFTHLQEAKYNPGNKDIEADTTEYNAASGGGDGSTVIQTTGCTYDHFTYITGGSFSVTATSGPNNTIIFTYPENPTTSARIGYVYVTYYDEDGNPYGPQTITFSQQAGSSPGPGPGPEPESGYVLTTLTISDQEQHRYFVEARPGVVYSAAGQYYKTVLACEARYSLYYVNSYGGVDVLPFKEKGWKKSDTVTRFNYSRSFRNNTLEFENVNYMNSIEEEYELHTGWMTDEESMRMHELIESTIVYLYDALEKTYIPVVMTDKKLEYKTYHNQGKKFYNYTVNCKASQSRERR